MFVGVRSSSHKIVGIAVKIAVIRAWLELHLDTSCFKYDVHPSSTMNGRPFLSISLARFARTMLGGGEMAKRFSHLSIPGFLPAYHPLSKAKRTNHEIEMTVVSCERRPCQFSQSRWAPLAIAKGPDNSFKSCLSVHLKLEKPLDLCLLGPN